jgi:RNA polymerase sigma factor for flagellar operon FliA
LPRSAVSRVRQIEGVLAELEQRFGRPAREEEAAAAIGVTTDRYRHMLLEMSATVLSLDAPLGSLMQEDELTALSDLIEDEDAPEPGEQVAREELARALAEAIERLPQREQLLLSLYYKEELTMKQISKIIGVSESRVCQLHMQAVMRLRGTLQMYQNDDTKISDTRQIKNSLSAENRKAIASGGSRTRRQVS